MEKSILVIYSHTVKNSINHVSCTLWDFFGKGNNIQDWSEIGPALDLLTRMCSNSLSVSTLTDWLMILSSEELALCADSSLPCGSHCLQRSTKDLKGYTGAQLPANHQLLFFFFLNCKLKMFSWIMNRLSTWEEGSSWPELWSWKHIHPLGLQILPECHETSLPFSGNWWHKSFMRTYRLYRLCVKWTILYCPAAWPTNVLYIQDILK